MKHLDEFRDPSLAAGLLHEIADRARRPMTIMEVCGGQTHAIIRYGLDRLLPENVTLLHGPGCPVCVTPVELIDAAISISRRPGTILCSFGDMLRVPGSAGDLLAARAAEGDVRVVYSPLDSLRTAEENPGREVVWFAIGFETTAPANALAIHQAAEMGLKNFSVLSAQVLIPPAMAGLVASGETGIDAFLAAGHVCTIAGFSDYEKLTSEYNIPVVITGFEPLDILQGIMMAVRQLQEGRSRLENQYTRAVREEGNPSALALVDRVFRVVDRRWRGLGMIPRSGLALHDKYAAYDAARKFAPMVSSSDTSPVCISGSILRGRKKPPDCPAFAVDCTPEHPLGATMVSSEGACAAYYRYRGVMHEQKGQ